MSGNAVLSAPRGVRLCRLASSASALPDMSRTEHRARPSRCAVCGRRILSRFLCPAALAARAARSTLFGPSPSRFLPLPHVASSSNCVAFARHCASRASHASASSAFSISASAAAFRRSSRRSARAAAIFFSCSFSSFAAVCALRRRDASRVCSTSIPARSHRFSARRCACASIRRCRLAAAVAECPCFQSSTNFLSCSEHVCHALPATRFRASRTLRGGTLCS